MARLSSRGVPWRTIAGGGGVVLGSLLAVPRAGYAHATLVGSEPAANAMVRDVPSRIRLLFSEPVEASLGGISLVSDAGRATDLAVTLDPHNVHAIVAPVAGLEPGTYRVVWHVVSADGHPVEGSFVFTVAASGERTTAATAPPPSGRVTAAPRPAFARRGSTLSQAAVVAALVRGMAVGCAMALAGVLLFLRWCAPRSSRRARRVALWLALATPLLLAAHLVAWLVDISPAHHLESSFVRAALRAVVGRAELVRLLLAVLALWALAIARRVELALVFAGGVVLASGAVGHAAAIRPVWSIPAKALHLAAASIWLGGLLWVMVREVTDSDNDATLASDARRVSAAALGAVCVVALSGLVQTWIILPSPADLVRSPYGALVLVKLAGLLTLVAFGAYHRTRMLPALSRIRTAVAFRRAIAREIAVFTAVVLIAGLLAYVPTPEGARPMPATSATSRR